MPRPIIFGEIEGVVEGQWFKGRREMMPTSFHRSWARGIDGNGITGASAIALSGGYEDDKDLGDEIIYTGAGGNDPNTGHQIKDQSWENAGNAALVRSMNEGLPVRVIRGHKHNSPLSPSQGHAYAGLYSVIDAWLEQGISGFQICRFKLVYSGDNTERGSVEEIEGQLDHRTRERRRVRGTVLRVVRDSQLAHAVKSIYNHECQVCGTAIPTKNGFYSEGAHIRPLGRPHNGDDSLSNLICLCPNHHVMLDKGSFAVQDDLSLAGAVEGFLTVSKRHNINLENVAYHRSCHGYD